MKKLPKHVLVAEDDTFLLGMMQNVLKKNGLKVTCASNGKEAIKVLGKYTPDLLLLDLLMPHADGYAVLQFMEEKKMDFPVVVCSNLSDKASKEKCKKFGVKAFLVKSDLDDEQLWPVISKFIR